MRILMVNKFLYPKGGAETYMLSLGEILRGHGHEVQYFGLRNEKNTVGNEADALVPDMDFSKGIMKNLKAPFRIVYNFGARKQIRKVLDSFDPDIVHLNNIQYHLTPSIILETEKWRREKNKACRIIYSVHDYQLICPSHGLFDVNVKPCELCLDGKYYHCLQTKCLKGSSLKSFLGMLDGYYWKKNPAYSFVDAYVCCSRFLKEKLDTQERFRGKTVVLHNFSKTPSVQGAEKKDYILEFGKLCRDKGTETLLQAARRLPGYKFVFAGYGPSVESIADVPNAEYRGFLTGDELYRLIAEARVSVCPSEWYENCPFSVIESVALGTPVIGSRMGGIPELIEEGKTGILFEAGNADDLTQAILKIASDPGIAAEYSENCRNARQVAAEDYYSELMCIYGTPEEGGAGLA